jgi:hypothetical protein
MHRREFLLAAASPLFAAGRTRNVVLVTCDGLRWQEVFTGIDPLLMNEKAAHMDQARALRDRFWRESPQARREALLPFFWTKLATRAVIHDNVRVTNAYRVSYPGYSEILTGKTQDDVIRGNDPKQNPSETVLQTIRQRLALKKEQVAVFGSWDAFQWISENVSGSIFIDAGYAESNVTPRIAELSKLQRDIPTDDESSRYDWFTFEMALDYLKNIKPRVLYIAFNDSDEWAHKNRYNRVLETINYYDRCFEILWNTLQSMPEYRDQTALIITADHGRGSTLADWGSHGSRVTGADRIWLAAAGPEKLDLGPQPKQRDIAPAMLRLLGL